MESTKGKTCIKGAMVEVTQRDPLFKDISVCGDWCSWYSQKYNTCLLYLEKELNIEEKIINKKYGKNDN